MHTLTLGKIIEILSLADDDTYPDSTPVRVWDRRTEQFFDVLACVPDDMNPDGNAIELHIETILCHRWGGADDV